jgi:AsmA family protein
MKGMVRWQRILKWLLWTLASLIALVLAIAAALDAGYLHGPLVRFFASHSQREIRVEGPLRLRLFSKHPELVAEGVTVGNPPWTAPGTAVRAAKITVVFETPRLGRSLELESVVIEAATLRLVRDAAGHANWQMKNPDRSTPEGLPIFHSVALLDAHVVLDDAQKHRQFDGTVSAQDVKGSDAAQPFRIEAKGQLNGRPVSIEFLGDPLRAARSDQHYGFTFNERSSGSHLAGKGVLLHPFDVHYFDATFEANGADLKDLYYLTGTKLIDTGSYHLTGKLARRGYTSSFSDLAVTSGQSDVHGSASIEMQRGLTRIEGELNSQVLRLADLGPRAAGRDAEPKSAQPMLLSAQTPDPSALRHTEANVKYTARRLDAGRVMLNALAAKVTVDHGLFAVSPLSAEVLDGKLDAQLKIDARKEIPAVDLTVNIAGLQLGQYARKANGPPAIDGPLALQLHLAGRGKSLHEAAAGASGSIKATLPQGTVRDSLAELTGIDLRGLGLLLTKNKQEVPVRCGVASFQAVDGTLTAQNLVLDTEPVLIAGEGVVHLDTETLDFVLRGYPKSVRFFQLRSPILIRGTLGHPSVGIQAQDSKLVLVDPGKAKDTDCGTLLR